MLHRRHISSEPDLPSPGVPVAEVGGQRLAEVLPAVQSSVPADEAGQSVEARGFGDRGFVLRATPYGFFEEGLEVGADVEPVADSVPQFMVNELAQTP